MTFPPPQLPPSLPRATQSAPKQPRKPSAKYRRSSAPAGWRRNQRTSARNDMVVTNALISINIGLFLWMSIFNLGAIGSTGMSSRTLSFVISRRFLEQGEWYRLLSAGFVHFGLFHLAMNMLLSYQLGRMIEPNIGSLRYGLLYFTSLFGGSVGALLLSPDAITGGASGAVFGLMAAAVVGVRQQGVNPLRTGLGLTFAINVAFTLTIPGISVGGHFGGAAAGALCGAFLLAPARWRVPKWLGIVVPCLVSFALVAVAVNLVNA